MTRRDFITPPTLPTEFIQRCVLIPASQEWLGLMNAALLMLTQEWRYEQLYETSLTPAATAQAALEIYTAYLEGACGVDDVRQSIIDPCTLEKTFDQGATWEAWANLLACSVPVASARPPLSADIRVEDGAPEWSPDGGTTWLPITPSGGTRYTPPSAAVPGDTDEAKKCLAAARVARAMSEAYRGTFGMVAADLANNLGRMNNFLYDLNSSLFQVLYSPNDGILETWLFSAQDFEENYTAAALTAPQEAALTCLLLENALLIAGSKVQFEFTAVRDNLVSTLGANPGLALTYLFDNIGAAGIDWAGGSAIVAEGDEDCADCYTFCVVQPFQSNTQGWVTYTFATAPGGVNNSSGWQGTAVSPFPQVVSIELVFDEPVYVTNISMLYTNTASAFNNVLAADLAGTPVTSNTATANGSDLTKSITPNAPIDRIRILLRALGGSSLVKSVTIEGDVRRPEWLLGDDC